MNRLTLGRTTLVIAHRLSTVRTLDRLLVFDRGRDRRGRRPRRTHASRWRRISPLVRKADAGAHEESDPRATPWRPHRPRPLAPIADARICRRRCTEEGMFIASRHFVTVRRAISMPISLSLKAMSSSVSTSGGDSVDSIALIWWRTASAECAVLPWEEAIAAVKKFFSSNTPRGVSIYSFDVTRLTVNACMLIASATARAMPGSERTRPQKGADEAWRMVVERGQQLPKRAS